jgi:hypothetical protein
MSEQIKTVNEADGHAVNFSTFHPEISLIRPIADLLDQEIIIIDGIVMENYPTPRGPRDTVLCLACFSRDQYGKDAWFKFIESAVILARQINRWKAAKFPVKGVMVKEFPSWGHKYKMWFMK